MYVNAYDKNSVVSQHLICVCWWRQLVTISIRFYFGPQLCFDVRRCSGSSLAFDARLEHVQMYSLPPSVLAVLQPLYL